MDTRFDADLIRRYDRPGPRYTSYPTAPQFHAGIRAAEYERAARASNTAAGFEKPSRAGPGPGAGSAATATDLLDRRGSSHGSTPPSDHAAGFADAAAGRPLSLYLHIPYCRSSCYYCGCHRIITRNRARGRAYLDRLLKEIELKAALFDRSRPVVQLHFGGGTPTFYGVEEMAEIFAALERGFGLQRDRHRDYSIEIDPRTANPDSLKALVGLGINRISLGVQDFDPQVQRAVNRIQSVDSTGALVSAARAHGIDSINFDLIYGLPHQSIESFDRTLETVIALEPDRLAVYGYAHLPERFKAQAVIDASALPTAEARLKLLGRTIERLTAAGYVHIGMDHFAKPDDELAVAQRDGSLQRNFQGYTTHGGCDLVAFGISAIGTVGDLYTQNEKLEAAYFAALDAGRLPIARGLAMDRDDRIRRAVIGELMCFGRVWFPAIEQQYGIDFRDYFADALTKLEGAARDGLVVMDTDRLEVTDVGSMLLRIIAMAFDAYLDGSKRAAAVAARYSRVW